MGYLPRGIRFAAANYALAALAVCLLSQSAHAEMGERQEKSEKMKQRLEQLFIWRVSDRLQLTPSEETKFTEEFHRLSEERTKLSQQLDVTLDQIEKEKADPGKATKLLSEYTSALKKYNSLQSKEMDVMSHLFGTKKMVQYVLLKREMTQKFRDVLSAKADRAEAEKMQNQNQNQVPGQTSTQSLNQGQVSPKENPALKEPKVIEEQ